MTLPEPRPRGRRPRSRTTTAITVLCAAAGAMLVTLAWSIHSGTPLVQLDLAIVRTLHEHAFVEATAAATAITDLAATRAILLTAVVVAIGLVATRHRHAGLSVLVAVGATQLAVAALKGVVERGRPPDSAALSDPAGYSFPSGHSASAMAVYGLLALVVARHAHGGMRTAALLLAAGMVVAVGATRVYLGAHYPTDVVAGWLVGALVAAAAWWLAGRVTRRVVSA